MRPSVLAVTARVATGAAELWQANGFFANFENALVRRLETSAGRVAHTGDAPLACATNHVSTAREERRSGSAHGGAQNNFPDSVEGGKVPPDRVSPYGVACSPVDASACVMPSREPWRASTEGGACKRARAVRKREHAHSYREGMPPRVSQNIIHNVRFRQYY